MSTPRFTLTKQQRQQEKGKLGNDALCCKTRELTLLMKKNHLGYPRIKVIVPKKSVASSVKRNQIKRWVRENFRLQQHAMNDIDLVVIYRRPKQMMTFLSCQKAFSQLIDVCQKAC